MDCFLSSELLPILQSLWQTLGIQSVVQEPELIFLGELWILASSCKSATVALMFLNKSQRSLPASESSIYSTNKCPIVFDLRYLNGGARTFVKNLAADEDHQEGQYLDSILPSRTISDTFDNIHE